MLVSLPFVADQGREWGSLESKNVVMRALETAARIASEQLPRGLRTGDRDTNVWLIHRCNAIAASLRAKKMWVLMPKPDTRDRLEESLVACFVNSLTGDWDGVETAEEPLPVREGIGLRIRRWVLGILEALLPGALYLGAQRLGFLPAGSLSSYLGLGTVIWAVVVILSTLDPKFGEKIDAVHKTSSFIPGLGKKKDE
jgi:hypothetical protein